MATIRAAFNAGDNTYKQPNLPGDPTWYGDFDARVTQSGDYLIHSDSSDDIKFIAAQQSLLPIICIDCNQSVRLIRPATQSASGTTAVGALSYSGICASPAESTTVIGTDPTDNGGIAVGWPCSILFGGRTEKAGANLPTDVKNTGWRILLPLSVPITFMQGDILVDESGRRFSVQGAEQSDTGWRLNTQEAHA